MKNPMLCTIVFILSVIALGYAYYLVTGGVNETVQTPDGIKNQSLLGSGNIFPILVAIRTNAKNCNGHEKLICKRT